MPTLQRIVANKTNLLPDGVVITIPWEDMVVGSSVFVPCINTELAKKQARDIFEFMGWIIHSEIRVENGKYGVRIWRVV